LEIIETKKAFKTLIQKIKVNILSYQDPLAFGICKIDLLEKNRQKTPQAAYLVANSNENFASAAIFIQALKEQEVEVNFNKNEVVCDINEAFLKSCLNAFTPYIDEAHGDSHKNIQTILALYEQVLNNTFLDGRYKVTFIFKDDSIRSLEATSLNLSILNTLN